jgi:hypothetical protein
MTNYDWNCKTVDAYIEQEGDTDVVYNVHWKVTGISSEVDKDGNPYTYTNIGTQTLETDDITDFIPFDQVTNAEVVAWTKSAMGEEQVLSIEENISKSIDTLITPTTITLTVGEPVPPEEEL